MNILWDMRLFSLGYRTKGIGVYTLRMVNAILNENSDIRFFALGNKDDVPGKLAGAPVTWIEHSSINWKNDIVALPSICRRYHIDAIHYWVALGPIFKIGMGFPVFAKSIASVHDLGVAFWDEVPYLKAIRKTWYWRIQKSLFKGVVFATCNSEETRKDMLSLFPSVKATAIIPLPISKPSFVNKNRQPYFITLGGSPNKNVATVVEAFSFFRKDNPHFQLIILGDINRFEEKIENVPENVSFESMDRYEYHLSHSAGLAMCSLHEGLGIPPLEAMGYGCPLLLSDIPPFRETAEVAAYFVNPRSVQSIAGGFGTLSSDTLHWHECSKRGWEINSKRGQSAGKQWIDIYKDVAC